MAANYEFRFREDRRYENEDHHGFTGLIEAKIGEEEIWDRVWWVNKDDLKALCNTLQQYLVENPNA